MDVVIDIQPYESIRVPYCNYMNIMYLYKKKTNNCSPGGNEIRYLGRLDFNQFSLKFFEISMENYPNHS
jgi:hypothetical protein